jgi:hypothetical protein
MIEGIFLRSAHFAEAVWGRGAKLPLFADMDFEGFFEDGHPEITREMLSLLTHMDLGKFFTNVDTWLGVIVCGLLTTAAIYVRRFRDES